VTNKKTKKKLITYIAKNRTLLTCGKNAEQPKPTGHMHEHITKYNVVQNRSLHC